MDDDDDEIHIRQIDKVLVPVTAGELLPVVYQSMGAASEASMDTMTQRAQQLKKTCVVTGYKGRYCSTDFILERV
jgi:hypothetical protein